MNQERQSLDWVAGLLIKDSPAANEDPGERQNCGHQPYQSPKGFGKPVEPPEMEVRQQQEALVGG
jgi:hypothetical protein